MKGAIHPLVLVGVGAIVMIGLFVGFTNVGSFIIGSLFDPVGHCSIYPYSDNCFCNEDETMHEVGTGTAGLTQRQCWTRYPDDQFRDLVMFDKAREQLELVLPQCDTIHCTEPINGIEPDAFVASGTVSGSDEIIYYRVECKTASSTTPGGNKWWEIYLDPVNYNVLTDIQGWPQPVFCTSADGTLYTYI